MTKAYVLFFNMILNMLSEAHVGYSGYWKSKCVRLIKRYNNVQEGEILLDDVNIKNIDSRWLHK